MSTTVQQVLDQARVRHWAFREVDFPDGAALSFVNQRQRTLLGEYGPAIEGLVGSSVAIGSAIGVDDALVGVDANGALYQTETTELGYAVHVTDAGDLYIEDTDDPLSVDPFGADGGTPGFPLPTDFIRLINVLVVLDDNTQIPAEVREERLRLEHHRAPVFFPSGNRLVPARALSEGNSGDIWDQVASVQISYIAMQTVTAMTDALDFPSAIIEALIAALANTLAQASSKLKADERARFREDAREAAAAISDVAGEMIRAQSSIVFRR